MNHKIITHYLLTPKLTHEGVGVERVEDANMAARSSERKLASQPGEACAMVDGNS